MLDSIVSGAAPLADRKTAILFEYVGRPICSQWDCGLYIAAAGKESFEVFKYGLAPKHQHLHTLLRRSLWRDFSNSDGAADDLHIRLRVSHL